MAYYLIKARFGLESVESLGDGYSIKLKWYQAYPKDSDNSIAYNIYWSTSQDNVFRENAKFVSIDSKLETIISGFDPGQVYFFGVRPIEYNSVIYDYTQLIDIENGTRGYQESLLASNIDGYQTSIELEDASGFPLSGFVRIGYELIEYNNIANNILNVVTRGASGTTARLHDRDGYDGIEILDPNVQYYLAPDDSSFDKIIILQSRFEYPNYSFTQQDGYKQVIEDLLYTDLSGSDAQNIDFPRYDYTGYHRTDPRKILSGECVGSYIGGQRYCADGYNVGMMVRGISSQDASLQRLEMLLESTGEPVVLLKKQNTGIVCSCYLPTSEYADDRCPKCFAEGTIIRTSNGFEEIQNIKEGDFVLSANGKFNKVIGVSKKQYTGKLKCIKASSSINPILVTPEHEFVALRGHHKTSKKCSPSSNCKIYIKKGDGARKPDIRKIRRNGRYHLVANVKGHKKHSLGVFNTKEEALEKNNEYNNKHFHPGHELKWDYAKSLEKGHWIVSKWNLYEKDIEHISIPNEFLKNTKLGSKRQGAEIFELDEEFLWICGLYIAEGSSSKRSINFALHEDEKEYQNRVINYFKSKGFNPKLSITKNSKGVKVDVHGTSLAKWFPVMLGKGCENKKIPNEFTTLPINKIKAIIDGIFCGDGCKRDNCIIQTSKTLAMQLVELLHKIGKMPMASIRDCKILTENGNKRKIAYNISYEKDNYTRDNRFSRDKGKWRFSQHMLTKVNDVSEVEYDGYVYNLEVENDHSYVVENILVHNCFGSKFTLGHNQYFNPRRSDGRIMVRFSPAEDDVKVYEAGRESEFITDIWTLTVPTIADRDVLVRYDESDNEEYRYEILSVNRQKTVLRQQGSQKAKVQRIRKTDPIYNIPVFANTSTIPQNFSTTYSVSNGIPLHKHDIKINEKTLNNFNQVTSLEAGHSHVVKYNSSNNKLEVSVALGHTHEILL